MMADAPCLERPLIYNTGLFAVMQAILWLSVLLGFVGFFYVLIAA
jgi:hypothetical protein